MKALVLLISVFSLTAAQAVVRKDCPESITVTFNKFKMNDVIDDNFEPLLRPRLKSKTGTLLQSAITAVKQQMDSMQVLV